MCATQAISRFDQLKTVADSQRLALLRRLMAGPASLTELGQHFGETPAHLRHHLKALEEVGLVALDSTRPVRGFIEKRYRATAEAYLIRLAILPEVPPRRQAIVLGSNDSAARVLAESLSRPGARVQVQVLALDSLNGLISLQQGLCHLAGCHLLDAASGEYNTAYISRLFPGQTMAVVRLAQRAVGFMVKAGNPLRLRALPDLLRPDVRFVNRERGSGTRLWLDAALRQAGLPASAIRGYGTELSTHAAVAQAVRRGSADVGLGIAAVAEQQIGLDFVPLFEEPYDLVLPKESLAEPAYQALFDHLCSADFRRSITGLTGYDANASGASRELRA
jgi:putative molybdopterin biosynthesis protein